MKKQAFHLLLFLLFTTLLMGVGLSVPPAHAQTETALPWTPPTSAYKIMVEQTGLYELSYADLAGVGLPLDVLDPRTFQMFNNGEEIAILVQGEADGSFDEGDSILFFGQKADTRYTHVNVYWLTYGAASGLRMGQRPSLEGGDSLPSYPALARYEDNQIYISTLPLAEGHDHWYGPSIQAAGYNNPGQRTFSLPLDAVAGLGEATLEGLFAGNVTGVHHLRLYVNDQLVYEGSWSGRTLYPVNASVPQTALRGGENSVRAVLLNDESGQAFDMVYLDWLQLRYVRQLVARDQMLLFDVDQAGRWQYEISGFDASDVQILDVTDPANVQQITGDTPEQSYVIYLPVMLAGPIAVSQQTNTGNQTIRFGDDVTAPRRYLVAAPSGFLSPRQITQDTPSDLQHVAQSADYILITHHDFQAQAQRLADYRSGQGMRTVVVDVQDIYDEFNGGLMSAEAIHDFLAYAYEHWPAPAPQYVLLLGDGTYDMRHYLPDTAPTYIPPYLAFIDTLLGEVASDNRFVTLSGDDNMPDMNIGRMPANTLAEAETMISKTIAYETQPAPGDWNRNVLFVTDDLEGGGGDFYALSDELADGYADPPANTIKFLPAPYLPAKIYAGRTCDQSNPAVSVECKQQIVDALEGPGALILNYIGHATKTYWAAERLMDQAAVESLHNEGKWPITLSMSCVDGFFQEPRIGAQSFAEANVRAQGGSVASWSATSLGLANPHQLLEKGLFLALFHDRVTTLGAATTAAKRYLIDHAPQETHYLEAVDAYMLFGDPALRVELAPNE
jgi:hypothetical protein